MQLNKVTIRLGVTKPSQQQYESIRADITCEYDLTALEGDNIGSKDNKVYSLIKTRTEKLLNEAIKTAEKTLHPVHEVESGKLEFKDHGE
tara:strand:+ start:42 stop:311 length:270 start_codon:yes stop_codon:yes gene_type:complete